MERHRFIIFFQIMSLLGYLGHRCVKSSLGALHWIHMGALHRVLHQTLTTSRGDVIDVSSSYQKQPIKFAPDHCTILYSDAV